ncbi:MAG TPA: hypothetical protein VNP20_09400 [Nocardioidaceae bacterium]|nr:hypothetical protein [Nocardioidaceae bacterium]
MSLPALPTAEAVTLPKSFSLTLVGEPNSFIAGGEQWQMDETNARLVIQDYAPSDSSIDMTFDTPGTPALWDYWNVQVAGTLDPTTRESTPLVAGHYPRAVRPIAREAGEAGLEVSNGHGCTNHGSFDLRDIHFTDGVVDRMWLLFEMSCGTRPGSYFGEIRIGMDTPTLAATPAAVAWPDNVYPRSGRGEPVQVRMRSTRAARVRSVALVGPHPGQFQLRQDRCTGQRVNGCTVRVTFDPTRPGPATATVRMVTSAGVRRTRLDGLGAVGTTRLDMVSERGDWVGQGRTYAFAPGDAPFFVHRHEPYHLESNVNSYSGQRWGLEFITATSQPLSERTYTGVARAGFGNAPAMRIFGNQRGCNTLTGDFTVHDLGAAANGTVEHLDLSFVQYCDGSTAALRGRLRYRAGPDHAPPPQIRDLQVRRVDGRVVADWVNPRRASGFAGVTARWHRGSGAGSVAGTPLTGQLAYAGGASAFSIPDPAPRSPLTVSFFTHDSAGNVRGPLALTR